MKQTLNIQEFAKKMGVAESTIRKWLGATRKGRGHIPNTISPPGYKCLWSADEIMRFIESQSTSPVANTTVTSAKQQRRKAQDYQRRQEIAKAIIDAHRKTK